MYEFKPNQMVKEFMIGMDTMADIMPRLLDKALAVKYAVEDKKEPACYSNPLCSQCERFE